MATRFDSASDDAPADGVGKKLPFAAWQRRCTYTRADGERCSNWAMRYSDAQRCPTHNSRAAVEENKIRAERAKLLADTVGLLDEIVVGHQETLTRDLLPAAMAELGRLVREAKSETTRFRAAEVIARMAGLSREKASQTTIVNSAQAVVISSPDGATAAEIVAARLDRLAAATAGPGGSRSASELTAEEWSHVVTGEVLEGS